VTGPALGVWVAYFSAVGGIFGLLIGSFLNVVAYRLPVGRSIVSPPSACPGCGSEIKPYDNIPVLSWLLLRGKCRSCRTRISVRYPIVEAATGAFFAAVVLWFLPKAALMGPSSRSTGASAGATSSSDMIGAILVLVAFLYLAAISVVLALIDIDTHTLPNAIVLPSYVVGAVPLVAAAAMTADFQELITAAIGCVALCGLYLVMALVYPGGMGFGDVKLAGLLGLYLGYLGWGPLVVGSFAAFLLGGLFALALVALRRAGRKSGIPFGPWMLAGAWTGVFFGNTVWSGYLSLFGLS
jgi:leader peptidase (prepilin peptidase)/N-methyltransferase